jgi:hypothetical protein
MLRILSEGGTPAETRKMVVGRGKHALHDSWLRKQF